MKLTLRNVCTRENITILLVIIFLFLFFSLRNDMGLADNTPVTTLKDNLTQSSDINPDEWKMVGTTTVKLGDKSTIPPESKPAPAAHPQEQAQDITATLTNFIKSQQDTCKKSHASLSTLKNALASVDIRTNPKVDNSSIDALVKQFSDIRGDEQKKVTELISKIPTVIECQMGDYFMKQMDLQTNPAQGSCDALQGTPFGSLAQAAPVSGTVPSVNVPDGSINITNTSSSESNNSNVVDTTVANKTTASASASSSP